MRRRVTRRAATDVGRAAGKRRGAILAANVALARDIVVNTASNDDDERQ